jgi:hypothetical protein
MNKEKFCLSLACCETEKEVIPLLKKEGLWDDPKAWQYFGGNENNFATIGNQQSRPEAALIEKIINSVDAVLMAKCLRKSLNPESKDAPQTITDALKQYFKIYNGKLSNLSASERTELAQNISLVATGSKSNPCYEIIDKGEGQSPDQFPSTLVSIGKSNKLRIPFVQGKFNMGGTGVLQFCGENNLQLIISRRHPEIIKNYEKETSDEWGFTIIRRENPNHGLRSSSYKYLAPDKKILSFKSDGLPLLPGKYPNSHENILKWGTFIKLYEYQMTGLRTNILFDLYNRLSLLLPNIALPVRLYERRKGYRGHSLETTLSGLSVRLDDDKRENLENGFPSTSKISVLGQPMTVSIYAFKKKQEKKYKNEEGIIFIINGQTHGHISRSFFARQAVKMGYLKESLFIIVDCSDIQGRAREDLFMNSRDRLRSGKLKSKIEESLQDLLKNHPGLKELRERRRREEIKSKLEDSKPLENIISSILKKSPTLSKLFIQGARLPNPFKIKSAKSKNEFVGQKFPSFFKLTKNYSLKSPKQCPINLRFRVQFKTDAENDYFDRDNEPGEFQLYLNDMVISDYTLNLWNGIANLNVNLPRGSKVEDILHLKSEVNDLGRIEPFINEFFIRVDEATNKKPGTSGKRKPPSSKETGNDVEQTSYLDLPYIVEVRKSEWDSHNFNKESALKVLDSGENGYDFFINMDNIHVQTEIKLRSDAEPDILEARYKYGMVLIGLAFLKTREDTKGMLDKCDESINIEELVYQATRAISPVLLPMISGLGELDE